MSSYLESGDSTDDSVDNEKAISEEELAQIKEECVQLKSAGNELFSQSLYTEAIVKYSEAVKILKNAHLPKDSIILLNRCAAYLAINKYVPALNDANQAIEIDPENWKGHWRKGVALMSMAKRPFRTKQALEAFETCASCSSLPASKRSEVQNELNKARARMEQQDAESPPPDLSKCVPS
eukprot:gene23298-31626_t